MSDTKTKDLKVKIEDKLRDKEILKEIKVLGNFVEIYCRNNHSIVEVEKSPFRFWRIEDEVFKKKLILCKECTRLLAHGIGKRLQCPYDPKPMCKKCPTHCYKPFYREKMREVMRFSGTYLIKHGRVDLLFHYYF